jgi:glutamyl-Q tRNA(Asp) synthetase
MSKTAFRFAPSPNGPLHLGHAYSALIGHEMAKRAGGRFLVRIEDIDVTRCREEHVAAIFDDLAWLGLSWEEPVVRQSQHFGFYAAAAGQLEAQGLLYPCFATRAEIAASAQAAPTDPDGAPLYPGLWKGQPRASIEARIARSERFALRIDMERALKAAGRLLGGRPLTFTELDDEGNASIVAAHPERWGDAVILRKDVPASYHLAVVIDDARQGITHVTRGRDLYAATDLQRLLQVLLGLREPLYHHHPLILDPEGRKLAKSEGASGLSELRAAGITPEAIRARLGLV